jgi:hypothetical protein
MARSKRQMTHRRAPSLRSRLDVTRLASAAGATQGDIGINQTYAKVGHQIPTAGYLQVRAGQLYCEVTTDPDGDEIVARVALEGAGLGSGKSFPLEFGCRVLLEFPAGDTGAPSIVARYNDLVCQMPQTVALVPLNTAAVAPETVGPAPFVSYQKNPPGALDARETTGADSLEHATGGSMEKLASVAAMIDAPFVHLGPGAGFLVPPIAATVGPAAPVPGVPGIPDPSLVVPIPNAAGIPGFGVVRHSDTIVANPVSDPILFTWILQVQTWIVGAHALPFIGPILSGLGIVPPVLPPIQVLSAPLTSSLFVTSK